MTYFSCSPPFLLFTGKKEGSFNWWWSFLKVQFIQSESESERKSEREKNEGEIIERIEKRREEKRWKERGRGNDDGRNRGERRRGESECQDGIFFSASVSSFLTLCLFSLVFSLFLYIFVRINWRKKINYRVKCVVYYQSTKYTICDQSLDCYTKGRKRRRFICIITRWRAWIRGQVFLYG